MKKKAIWGVGFTLLLVFVVLFGLQYTYYQRVISIRKEQTRQMAKEVLAEVAGDIELRELIRYLNLQLGTSAVLGQSESPIHLPYRHQQEKKATIVTDDQAIDGNSSETYEDSELPAISNRMMQAYLMRRDHLDEYILRHIYEEYSYDSIPQLINPRFLTQQLRTRLDSKGVCEAYNIILCDARGRKLYEFTQPGMLQKKRDTEDVVIQRLFVKQGNPNQLTPFLRLTLDFSPSRSEMLSFALPGVISTIFVLILGCFVIVILVRHLSFHSMKTSFINNMTHELKTPVSSIKLASSRLREQEIIENPDKRRRFISIIEHETGRMQLLIDKVLQFSVLDSKTDPMPLKELELNEILLPVAEIYTAHAQNKGGDLTLDLEAYDTWIKANRVHLTNVIFNLLDNSVKYAHPDRPLQLRLATENVESYIKIVVEDNGIGIPKESLKKVFDRYYRVPTGHRHDVKGFGLGLAYVASVIRQFDGRIYAESGSEGGTRMVIKLPVSKGEA
ncbi:MAG: HAMP domain-containing sensor histidine kinase [Porphyromonadaceae bacterium]|nr:HAMP domain-containing sensor histidine kinase [Porphyromonadaceae bacterium]